MEKNTIPTMRDLQCALRDDKYWARGTNHPVEHLPATGATSRWDYENIFGIYMAGPSNAWIELWMGVTNRREVRKRHLWYVRPDTETGDYVGKVRIFSPNGSQDSEQSERLGDSHFSTPGAYLYLVNPERFKDLERVDIKDVDKSEKMKRLSAHGFAKAFRLGHSYMHATYYRDHGKPEPRSMLVEVDDWQIALVNVPRIEPDVELFITPGVVKELAETRASRAAKPPEEKYILDCGK